MTRSETAPRPEFSRTVDVDLLGDAPARFKGEATDEERAALRARLNLRALDLLRYEAEIAPWRGGGRLVTMTVTARAVQNCVVTLEPVPARVDETAQRGFLPASRLPGEPEAAGREIELHLDSELDDPPEPLGRVIDLGEIAVEIVALALPDYPRHPSAGDALPEVETEPEEKPFAALAALKDKMSGGKGD